MVSFSDMFNSKIFILCVTIFLVNGQILQNLQVVPPNLDELDIPEYRDLRKSEEIARNINALSKDDDRNPWEMSGLFEGDILVEERNGVLDRGLRWPHGIVPYYIVESDFNATQQLIILNGFEEYHEKSCIKFRPYQRGDKSFIVIRGNGSGCWSKVGRRGRGQIVHLQTPGCVHNAIVVHELLHALGFFHQQSSADRDNYVKILWQNIRPGMEHNFNKYDRRVVSNYGVEYDYKSVMHYSRKAFSKNRKDTMVPLKANVKLGQRIGMSDKDVLKLQKMYRNECRRRRLSANIQNEGPLFKFEQQFEAISEYIRGYKINKG